MPASSTDGRSTVVVEGGSGVKIVPAYSSDPARPGEQACSVHLQMNLDPRMRMVPASVINFILRVRPRPPLDRSSNATRVMHGYHRAQEYSGIRSLTDRNAVKTGKAVKTGVDKDTVVPSGSCGSC